MKIANQLTFTTYEASLKMLSENFKNGTFQSYDAEFSDSILNSQVNHTAFYANHFIY